MTPCQRQCHPILKPPRYHPIPGAELLRRHRRAALRGCAGRRAQPQRRACRREGRQRQDVPRSALEHHDPAGLAAAHARCWRPGAYACFTARRSLSIATTFGPRASRTRRRNGSEPTSTTSCRHWRRRSALAATGEHPLCFAFLIAFIGCCGSWPTSAKPVRARSRLGLLLRCSASCALPQRDRPCSDVRLHHRSMRRHVTGRHPPPPLPLLAAGSRSRRQEANTSPSRTGRPAHDDEAPGLVVQVPRLRAPWRSRVTR